MKTHINKLFLVPVLIAGLGLLLAGQVTAQTFTTLHSFAAADTIAHVGGESPLAGLVLSGNSLYGMAGSGGISGSGTLFKLNTDGTGFTTLYSFTAIPTHSYTNGDGAAPSSLILSGNTLYGTAGVGGGGGNGTVFKLNTNGTGFATLYTFTPTIIPSHTNADGANPLGLILSSNTLYGTTFNAGPFGGGTVFKLAIDGTGFTTLYRFATSPAPSYTNGDGSSPSSLILSGNTLYGTACVGGSGAYGTVFKLNTNGTEFSTLYHFTGGSDGGHPNSGLVLSSNILYGTASDGGVPGGDGTVFAVSTDGREFTTLYRFTPTAADYDTNSDGRYPSGGLVSSGNALYGTASLGGTSGSGTIFKVNTDGTGFITLYSLKNLSSSWFPSFMYIDGGDPSGILTLSEDTLYGTAYEGGSSYSGSVFSISLSPKLELTRSAANILLTWPTSYAGFDYTGFTLQSTTNLDSTAVWSAVSAKPVVIDGQNAITNPISGSQQFYRLSQ